MKFQLSNTEYNRFNVSNFGRKLKIFIIPVIWVFFLLYPIIFLLYIFINAIQESIKFIKQEFDYFGFLSFAKKLTKAFFEK